MLQVSGFGFIVLKVNASKSEFIKIWYYASRNKLKARDESARELTFKREKFRG